MVRLLSTADVAAKHLARKDASTIGLIGCGRQAWTQMMSCNAVACTRPEDAADADIVVTTTPSRKPILKRAWIRPGTHINAIGADAPGKQELETMLTVAARVFVDSVDQASHSGEINVPWSEGKLTEEMLAGTLGEVIAGIRPGRTDDRQITIFDSTGLSIRDTAVAHMVYERAIMEGIGKEFDMLRSRPESGKQKVAAQAQ